MKQAASHTIPLFCSFVNLLSSPEYKSVGPVFMKIFQGQCYSVSWNRITFAITFLNILVLQTRQFTATLRIAYIVNIYKHVLF